MSPLSGEDHAPCRHDTGGNPMFHPTFRPVTAAGAAAAISAGILLLPAAAAAAPPPQVQQAYVALGDSLSVDVGASGPAQGYVAQVADSLAESAHGHRVFVDNFGVSGATSTDLVIDQLGPAVAAIAARQSSHGEA